MARSKAWRKAKEDRRRGARRRRGLARHRADPLTQRQVDELEEGTEVLVTWPSGHTERGRIKREFGLSYAAGPDGYGHVLAGIEIDGTVVSRA